MPKINMPLVLLQKNEPKQLHAGIQTPSTCLDEKNTKVNSKTVPAATTLRLHQTTTQIHKQKYTAPNI